MHVLLLNTAQFSSISQLVCQPETCEQQQFLYIAFMFCSVLFISFSLVHWFLEWPNFHLATNHCLFACVWNWFWSLCDLIATGRYVELLAAWQPPWYFFYDWRIMPNSLLTESFFALWILCSLIIALLSYPTWMMHSQLYNFYLFSVLGSCPESWPCIVLGIKILSGCFQPFFCTLVSIFCARSSHGLCECVFFLYLHTLLWINLQLYRLFIFFLS